MTKSSRTRKHKARAKKRIVKEAAEFGINGSSDEAAKMPQMSPIDKRYLIGFAVLSAVITVFYWWLGGRNLLVFPAVLCISVGARKYWKGPIRRYAEQS